MNIQPKNKLALLFLLPVLMFGFGYLMVPIYNVFCDLTGLNGKTGAISTAQAANLAIDRERRIKVEFIATLNQQAEWDFGPAVASMMVHPGQQYKTHFYARNQRSRAVVGQAIPSVAPGRAATHFNKTECFCFNQQQFAPLESRDLPLVFVVDPDIPADIETVTLSYTLFDIQPQQIN